MIRILFVDEFVVNAPFVCSIMSMAEPSIYFACFLHWSGRFRSEYSEWDASISFFGGTSRQTMHSIIYVLFLLVIQKRKKIKFIFRLKILLFTQNRIISNEIFVHCSEHCFLVTITLHVVVYHALQLKTYFDLILCPKDIWLVVASWVNGWSDSEL